MAYRVGTQKRIMNLPTKITVTRIALIGVMLLGLLVLACIPDLVVPDLVIGDAHINPIYIAVFFIFIIASTTDAIDGHLARKNNQVTNLGKFLDPVADKMLVNATMIFLLVPQAYALSHARGYLANTIMMFCVILMIIRDLVIDVLRLIAVEKKVVIAANKYGKLKTIFQMVAIPCVLINDWPFCYIDFAFPEPLKICYIFFYLATIMSLVSGIIYIKQNINVLKETN